MLGGQTPSSQPTSWLSAAILQYALKSTQSPNSWLYTSARSKEEDEDADLQPLAQAETTTVNIKLPSNVIFQDNRKTVAASSVRASHKKTERGHHTGITMTPLPRRRMQGTAHTVRNLEHVSQSFLIILFLFPECISKPKFAWSRYGRDQSNDSCWPCIHGMPTAA